MAITGPPGAVKGEEIGGRFKCLRTRTASFCAHGEFALLTTPSLVFGAGAAQERRATVVALGDLSSAAWALFIADDEECVVGFNAALNIAQGDGGLKTLRIAHNPLAELELRLINDLAHI